MLTNCIKRYPLSLITMFIISVLSLAPIGRIEIAEDVPFADKWTHMVMYAGLTTVIWFEYLRHHDRLQWRQLFVWAFIAPIVMSGCLELLQAYCTSYRSGEWLDLLANSVGVAIGTGIGFSIHLFFSGKRT